MMIHRLADCQTTSIGEGTRIWQFSVVLAGAKIGSGCNVNAHCFIENDVVLGNDVTVKCGVYLWDGLRVEDSVFIGPNVSFTNDKYPRSKQHPVRFLTTTLKRGCSVGAGAVICPGVTIGEKAMIAAGALVTRDVPPATLAIGSPARHQPLPARMPEGSPVQGAPTASKR